MSGPSEFIKRAKALRDDITVEVFGTFGQTNREASMALAKLDEAESWLIRWGLQSGSHILVDKAEYVKALDASKDHPVATDATDTGEETRADV